MIDIHFLTPPNNLKSYSGMELINYQGKLFFTKLTDFIKDIYNPTTQNLNWSTDNRKKLAALVATYTHIRITPTIVPIDNFAITAGFVSPNSVLNLPYVEEIIKKEDSSLGAYFKEFKRKSLTGWCDLKTGMVEGDFKDVEFTLLLPEKMFITQDELSKVNKNVTIIDLIAGAILHELGHAFFGLYFLSSKLMEDILFLRASADINAETNVVNKIKIVNALKQETGIDVAEEVTKTGKLSVIGFEKGAAERDYKRTLSLGVSQITPEILANAYAVRMGASAAIGAFFGVLSNKDRKLNLIALASLHFFALVTAFAPIAFGLILLSAFFTTFTFTNQLVNGSHETPYRTIKSALYDSIALIRKERNNDNKRIADELLKDAIVLDKMANDAKPFLEGTVIQRLLSRNLHGKDAIKIDIEHYTTELNYNPLSLYTEFKQ